VLRAGCAQRKVGDCTMQCMHYRTDVCDLLPCPAATVLFSMLLLMLSMNSSVDELITLQAGRLTVPPYLIVMSTFGSPSG